MLSSFLNSTSLLISLSTATSVLLHDMHLDKMTMAVMTFPTNVSSASDKLLNFGNSHTHTELSEALRSLHSENPQIQPRLSEDKKHLLQKRVMRGHHPFDSYYIPKE